MAAKVKISADVIKAYSEIDVSCIGDVVHGQGLNCIVEGILPLDRATRMCGPAVTMRHIAARDNKNWARHEQMVVEYCQAGDVLVIEMGGRMDGSTWGGNLNLDAQNRGLAGVVVDGTCRDTSQLIESRFPVYVRGVSNRHTHDLYYTCCMNNEPIQIGLSPYQVMVQPGDLICGDEDGLVVVPQELAAELLPRVQARHENDEKMTALMHSGKGHGDHEVDEVLAATRDYEGVIQAEGYRL